MCVNNNLLSVFIVGWTYSITYVLQHAYASFTYETPNVVSPGIPQLRCSHKYIKLKHDSNTYIPISNNQKTHLIKISRTII